MKIIQSITCWKISNISLYFNF